MFIFTSLKRRDLQRATTVLEMVKRREKTKREQLHLSIEIFEKRVQLKDFSGALLSELSATLKNARYGIRNIINKIYIIYLWINYVIVLQTCLCSIVC